MELVSSVGIPEEENSNMRFLSSSLIVCIIQMGCSSSSIVLSFETFNSDAQGRSATIIFQDGRKVDARNILAFPDSTHFVNEGTSAITVVPTHTMKKVVFINRGMGFLEGFGVGALIGSATVLALNAISPSSGEFGGADYVILFALLGGGAGGVIGGIPGVIIGHTYEYNFVNASEEP